MNIEKKQTPYSYGAYVNIPIKQEYKHPEPSKPDHSGDSEDEENTFIIYPKIDIQDPGCTKRYISWDGYISHYLEYEEGLKVKKGAFGYSASIEGTTYQLYKGSHTIQLYKARCEGHANQQGIYTSYHDLVISMDYTIKE